MDTVIESSLEIQSALREHRTRPALRIATPAVESQDVPNGESDGTATEPAARPATPSLEAERHQRLEGRLSKLRSEIADAFEPVLQGRRKFVEVLRAIEPTNSHTPSVSALLLKTDEPQRSKLKNLRNEIRRKLNEVQSISMGNQAVLIYTLDFYNRLLTGISTDQRQSNYYNSHGQTKTRQTGSLVRTNC